jgi:hypothetical protein
MDNRYLCFFDETGDHELNKIDQNFPIFVLSSIILPLQKYIQHIVPKVLELKYKYFPDEGSILHSRDIRKAGGRFRFLQNETVRERFMLDLTDLMERLNYELIICIIDKRRLVEKYDGNAFNPYELSLKVILERINYIVSTRNVGIINCLFESRGSKEDSTLELEFYRILNEGSEFVSSKDFKKCRYTITLLKKELNIIGIQLADLVGYPFARHFLNPEKPYLPYEIVKKKLLNKSERNYVLIPK